jgi:hypothetical protein
LLSVRLRHALQAYVGVQAHLKHLQKYEDKFISWKCLELHPEYKDLDQADVKTSYQFYSVT